MHKQFIFDKVVQHAKNMPRKACVGKTSYYRSEVGSCLIGCLISTSVYTPEIEGDEVSSAPVIEALQASNISIKNNEDLKFLAEIQLAHDSCQNSHDEEFKQELFKNLHKIAQKHNLNI